MARAICAAHSKARDGRKISLVGVALIFVLCSSGAWAQSFVETFESPQGTDNAYDIRVATGNFSNPDFWSPVLPASWGKQSGEVFLGPNGGQGAFWMKHDFSESLSGYYFTGSFLIAYDGLRDGETATLFISKPMDWLGTNAAWRLYYLHENGKPCLVFVFGLDTAINNPSATIYYLPISDYRPYDLIIDYDTARRFYYWAVNGKVGALSYMPNDYPLIGTEIIGSSGSATGHSFVYIVDNVLWYELPGLTQTPRSGLAAVLGREIATGSVPELSTWVLMGLGFASLGILGYRLSHRSVELPV